MSGLPHEQPQSPTSRSRLPYLRGLDGLRAIAVIAVVCYHAGLSLLGGFLGVESFFVLSGFLITALLYSEWQEHGRIDLRNFWLRRARRLFPALGLVLLGTAAIMSLLPMYERAGFSNDMLASIGYVMNWHLILSGQSYFDVTMRPPLLQHLWSLAIEEQFYLVWPLVFGVGLWLFKRWGMVALTLGLAIGSAVLMAILYQPGADPSRIYFGTDTRAAGLLLGATLAFLWQPWRLAEPRRSTGITLDLLGIAGLAGLIYTYFIFFEQHPWLYQGGFAIVALATAMVIAATTHPKATILPRLLELAPMRWLGVRSYGIYLWHWPIFMVTRPYIDITPTMPDWLFLALRIGVVLLLADLSYRFVEKPLREGTFGRNFGKRRESTPLPPTLRRVKE